MVCRASPAPGGVNAFRLCGWPWRDFQQRGPGITAPSGVKELGKPIHVSCTGTGRPRRDRPIEGDPQARAGRRMPYPAAVLRGVRRTRSTDLEEVGEHEGNARGVDGGKARGQRETWLHETRSGLRAGKARSRPWSGSDSERARRLRSSKRELCVDRRWEPGAGNPLAGFCPGGGPKGPSLPGPTGPESEFEYCFFCSVPFAPLPPALRLGVKFRIR